MSEKTMKIPFKTNLIKYGPSDQDHYGGHERIKRPSARKAWSWGIPVYQAYKMGTLVRLHPPGSIQCGSDVARLFDEECLRTADAGTDTQAIWQDCIYTVSYEHLTLHFSFADGSNPFLKFCTSVEQAIQELKRWSKNYNIVPNMAHSERDIAFYRLSEKNPTDGSHQAWIDQIYAPKEG